MYLSMYHILYCTPSAKETLETRWLIHCLRLIVMKPVIFFDKEEAIKEVVNLLILQTPKACSGQNCISLLTEYYRLQFTCILSVKANVKTNLFRIQSVINLLVE